LQRPQTGVERNKKSNEKCKKKNSKKARGPSDIKVTAGGGGLKLARRFKHWTSKETKDEKRDDIAVRGG